MYTHTSIIVLIPSDLPTHIISLINTLTHARQFFRTHVHTHLTYTYTPCRRGDGGHYCFLSRALSLTLPADEAKTAALKERVRVLEEEASFARRDKDSASDTAVVWERRVTAAEEEAARLRSEAKSLRAAASAASKEAEEQRGLVTQALNDVEASERNAAEAEAGLASARAAEATATRLLGAYEEQVRDLRSQIAVVQAAAGARDDDLRRDLDDMTSKWQRAQSAAEEQGLQALATAYGLNVNFSGGASMAQQHGQAGSGGGGEEEEGVAPRLASQLQLGVGGRGPASPAHQLQFSSRMGDDAGGSNSGGKAPSSSSSSGGSIVSVTEALISQLAHLQGELQQKRDAWAAQRAALQARVAAAEAAAEGADADARRAETTAADASASAAALRTELISLRGVKARTESEAALTASKLRDSEARLGALTAAHDAMQRQHAEASSALGDLRMRLEEQSGARAAASHMVSVLKDQLAGAHEESVSHKREVAALGREIAALKAALAGGSSGDAAAAAARLPFGSASGAASTSSSLSSSAASSSVSSAASWLNSALSGGGSSGASSPGRGGGGGSSGSVPQSALLASLHALEREKELLTEQVVMLTTRLAAMEGGYRVHSCAFHVVVMLLLFRHRSFASSALHQRCVTHVTSPISNPTSAHAKTNYSTQTPRLVRILTLFVFMLIVFFFSRTQTPRLVWQPPRRQLPPAKRRLTCC